MGCCAREEQVNLQTGRYASTVGPKGTAEFLVNIPDVEIKNKKIRLTDLAVTSDKNVIQNKG